MDNSPSVPQVSWNLSQHITNQLANILQQATYYYIKNDYQTCFDCLQSAKNISVQSFNDDERQEFLDAENEILEYLKGVNETIKVSNPKLYHKCWNTLYHKLNQYQTLLMDCLNKYGYLNPPKEDAKRMF